MKCLISAKSPASGGGGGGCMAGAGGDLKVISRGENPGNKIGPWDAAMKPANNMFMALIVPLSCIPGWNVGLGNKIWPGWWPCMKYGRGGGVMWWCTPSLGVDGGDPSLEEWDDKSTLIFGEIVSYQCITSALVSCIIATSVYC